MGGSDGTRAVSEVMGAILVFSFLITALGAYQVVVVPNVNEEVEFKHNNAVQQDFIDLRNSIHRSGTGGEDTSVSVDLGVDYPTRALTLNPPEQGGTLQAETTGPTGSGPPDLGVENATGIDGEVADYWDNSTHEFATGRVVYTPAYSLYDNAPRTVVENSLVYNQFDDGGDIPLSGQRVVSGREISLVTIESDLSTSQVSTTSVDVNAVSASSSEIAITNASNGDNVTVRIPTNLSEEVWVGQLLADQLDGAPSALETCGDMEGETAGDDDPDRYIHNCTYTEKPEFNVLTLRMERNTTYTLQLSRVAVGKSAAAPGPHYVVPLEGDDVSVPEQGTQRLVLQVRDRFNNPVSGATVNLSVDPASQGTLVVNGRSDDSFSNVRANEEGKIVAAYDAPSTVAGSPVPVDVEASYSVTPGGSLNASTRQNATFDLRVINASKINRTRPLFNSPNGIVVKRSNFTDNCGGTADKDCHLNVVLENLAGETRTVTDIRYTFVKSDNFNRGATTNSGAIELQPSGPLLELKNEYEPVSIVMSDSGPDREQTLEFHVCKSDCNGNDDLIDLENGDFFVVEVIIDGSERKTFFFSPTDADA